MAKIKRAGLTLASTMTFPILLASFGLGGAYGLYPFFAAISILFVVKLVRETKGKPLGGNVSVINKWK